MRPLLEAVADSKVPAVGKVVVVPGGRAGDAVLQFPGGEVLFGTERQLHEPALAEVLADTAAQRDDEFAVDLRADVEGAARRGRAGDVRHVRIGDADRRAQEPLPAFA